MVVLRSGDVVATCRMLIDREGTRAKLGRMAVERSERRAGVGRALIEAAHAWAADAGVGEVVLHAQTQALGFYERQGYIAEGPVFEEEGIPHRLARIDLGSRSEVSASAANELRAPRSAS